MKNLPTVDVTINNDARGIMNQDVLSALIANLVLAYKTQPENIQISFEILNVSPQFKDYHIKIIIMPSGQLISPLPEAPLLLRRVREIPTLASYRIGLWVGASDPSLHIPPEVGGK